MPESTRIVRLQAENFKRLVAVEVEPDGNLVVISGKNSQGKTSLMDVIWAGLGGGDATRNIDDIIRRGEQKATAVLEFDDGLVITRTWTRKSADEVKSKIEVKTKEGASFKSPQKILDEMLGKLTFDPLKFANMDAKAQVAELMVAIGKSDELEALESKRKDAYEKRADINRRIRDLEGELKQYDDVPAEKPESVSVSDLAQELESINEHNRYGNELKSDLDVHNNRANSIREELRKAEEAVERLRVELETENCHIDNTQANLDKFEPKDPEPVKEKIAQADEINEAARRWQVKEKLVGALGGNKVESDDLTSKIDGIEKQKKDIVASAELPVPGIGIGDNGVTLDGVSFNDAAANEKIRLSTAIAMAMNPQLRIIRIMDGSLLDSDSMELIAKMAVEKDYQIWVERVSDEGEGVIVIEDGMVANG